MKIIFQFDILDDNGEFEDIEEIIVDVPEIPKRGDKVLSCNLASCYAIRTITWVVGGKDKRADIYAECYPVDDNYPDDKAQSN